MNKIIKLFAACMVMSACYSSPEFPSGADTYTYNTDVMKIGRQGVKQNGRIISNPRVQKVIFTNKCIRDFKGRSAEQQKKTHELFIFLGSHYKGTYSMIDFNFSRFNSKHFNVTGCQILSAKVNQ